MESFLTRLKDIPSDLELNELEEFLSKEIISQPRFGCTVKTLSDVEDHFFYSESLIDKPTLALYQSMLGASSSSQVLAFLLSCSSGTSSEKFYEIPTHLISKMQGRACKTRDLEELVLQKERPLRSFNSNSLSLLLCNKENIILYARGEEVERVNCTNISVITPVPTSSSLEQFAVASTSEGNCKILSTTRKNLRVVGEFHLDTPKGEHIHWIDILNVGNRNIMYWGGNDTLRGKILWSYHSGIDFEALENNEKELFYEIPGASEIYTDNVDKRFKQIKIDSQDFSLHGNVLTLWSQSIEKEFAGKRRWAQLQSVAMGTSILSKFQDENIVFVWGSPQQYITINNENTIEVFMCGEKMNKTGNSMKLLKQASSVHEDLQCGCILYAHCR